jgi:hypothetical protein
MLHGMARAVSGGAVYVSDKPGQHDFTLLRRLVLPDGYVLRAQLPGRPTRDCLFSDVLRDNSSLLKVGVGLRCWMCVCFWGTSCTHVDGAMVCASHWL